MAQAAGRLQERDIGILLALAFLGAMDTVAIKRHHFPDSSDRVCRRRMSLLQRFGLVSRSTIGQYFGPSGRQPYVYTLTEEGAEALRTLRGIEDARVLSDVAPQFVAHTRDVARFVSRFNASTTALGIDQAQWRFEYDLTDAFRADPNPNTPYQDRYILHETFQPLNGDGKTKPFSYRADLALLLTYKGRTLIGYVERDESTEPLRVIRRKLRGIARLISEKRYTNHWPVSPDARPTIRVYFITKTIRRLRSLMDGLKNEAAARALRFAAEDHLNGNVLTDQVWYSVAKPKKPGALINV